MAGSTRAESRWRSLFLRCSHDGHLLSARVPFEAAETQERRVLRFSAARGRLVCGPAGVVIRTHTAYRRGSARLAVGSSAAMQPSRRLPRWRGESGHASSCDGRRPRRDAERPPARGTGPALARGARNTWQCAGGLFRGGLRLRVRGLCPECARAWCPAGRAPRTRRAGIARADRQTATWERWSRPRAKRVFACSSFSKKGMTLTLGCRRDFRKRG